MANLNPQQRAMLFAQSTRQHLQMLPKQKTNDLGNTLSFTLPKARLLSRIFLNVKVKYNIKHATLATIPEDDFTPFKLMRRVSLDLNNGFSPFVIDGKGLALYNMLTINSQKLYAKDSARAICNHKPYVASVAGADNRDEFTLQLPVTINERDPYGLVLLQNESTQVTLSVDLVSSINDVFGTATGYTVTMSDIEIIPMIETFSIPSIPEAYPDLTTLKLVSSKNEAFVGNGQNIIKLNVGTIYRKIALYITDDAGVPMSADDINSNMELIFNQADIPYSVAPRLLQVKNSFDYDYQLPNGVFVFDFSMQGVPNLGGSRDIIDTQKLTEFWVRFNTTKSGKITVISECLASLK